MKLPPQLVATGEEEIVANPFAVEALSSGLQAQPEIEKYVDYTASALQQSLDDGKRVVLFFHALYLENLIKVSKINATRYLPTPLY